MGFETPTAYLQALAASIAGRLVEKQLKQPYARIHLLSPLPGH
jgi:hypothetical protein